jgi:hypothetical protein
MMTFANHSTCFFMPRALITHLNLGTFSSTFRPLFIRANINLLGRHSLHFFAFEFLCDLGLSSFHVE